MIVNPLRIIVAVTMVTVVVIVTKQMKEALSNLRLSQRREVSVQH